MRLYVTIDEDSAKIPDVSIVEASAELLYGLVHQRYILTRAGLQAMVRVFVNSLRLKVSRPVIGVLGREI